MLTVNCCISNQGVGTEESPPIYFELESLPKCTSQEIVRYYVAKEILHKLKSKKIINFAYYEDEDGMRIDIV